MLLSVVCQNITRLAHPPQGGWTFWLLRLSTISKQAVKISLNTKLIEEQNKNDNNSQADEYTDNEGETIISSLFFGRG